MSIRTGRDIVHRWGGNPLIDIQDLSFPCSDVHNAGIVRMNGNVMMLVTIESLQGYTRIHRAASWDGINFSVDAKPFMTPPKSGPRVLYEGFGVRDPRITPMDGKFYITYLAEGQTGWRLALACTKDFESVEYLGYLSQVDVKNGILFPKKIGGRYALLKRPCTGSIWISYSDDLTFWGDEKVVMTPRSGHWDNTRIGGSAVPIEIQQGWLLIYYGFRETDSGGLMRLGAAILDHDDPSKVIARSSIPLLSPHEPYERIGDIPNMLFCCGAILREGELFIYYGGSDSCICLGTVKLEEVIEFCYTCQAEHDVDCEKLLRANPLKQDHQEDKQ